MTTIEAIERLSNRYMTVSMCIDSAACKSENEAVHMAVAALEKQVGKKPIGSHYAHMKCPSCNHRIPSGMGSSSRRRDNWCNYCGQKIDWS